MTVGEKTDFNKVNDVAQRAEKYGIRLYAMTNTGGNTWDFGAIPYQPAPYQWIDRYDSMEKCRKEYGLSGLLESHTYGFCPLLYARLQNGHSGQKILKAVLF